MPATAVSAFVASFSFGLSNISGGFASTALGYSSVAGSDFSLSVGYMSKTRGNAAVSFGINSIASGDYSLVIHSHSIGTTIFLQIDNCMTCISYLITCILHFAGIGSKMKKPSPIG